MQSKKISFELEEGRHSHNDLVLRLDGIVWRCDSYYLLLDGDRSMPPDREGEANVRVTLRRLLDQWHSAVAALQDGGEACYLPYDFSDQGTGWLRCQLSGTELLIQHGYADVEGWSFSPSDVGALLTDLMGFRSDGWEVVVPRDEFLRDIAVESA